MTLCGDVLPRQDRVTERHLSLIRQGRQKGFTAGDYHAVFAAVAESGFLQGSNGKWRASFEWLITPENMRKVLDGNYRDYSPPAKASPTPSVEGGNTQNSSFDTDEFFEAALRRSYEEMKAYAASQNLPFPPSRAEYP